MPKVSIGLLTEPLRALAPAAAAPARLFGRLEEMAGYLKLLVDGVAEMGRDVARMRAGVEGLVSEIESLRAEVRELAAPIEGIRAGVEQLDGRVSGVETNLEGIDALTSRLGWLGRRRGRGDGEDSEPAAP